MPCSHCSEIQRVSSVLTYEGLAAGGVKTENMVFLKTDSLLSEREAWPGWDGSLTTSELFMLYRDGEFDLCQKI